ncbi:MAG: hypothetical protein Q9217_004588 [Psora testacea]
MADTKQPPHPFRIAVLLPPALQLLDASPVDLFGMLTAEYLKACRLPAPLIASAIDISIIYVGESGPGTIAECTANAGLRITHSLDDKAAQPGNLDLILLPGPDPLAIPSHAVRAFVRGHAEAGSTVMTVCTGIFTAGHSGVLLGKRATGPRAILSDLKNKFPAAANWEDKRWVHDGNLWTSGGITNGQDMVAAFIKEKWPGPASEVVCAIADVGDRGVEYGSSQAAQGVWWIFQILRAWLRGLARR